MRDIQALQRLRDSRSLVDLHDAGEQLARQLPPMLRALGRDDRIEFPDFAMQPLLNGDEIASIAGIEPGPRIGEIKRALLEAELEGRVRSREEAERFIREKF
jgi:poly(A) polymerase